MSENTKMPIRCCRPEAWARPATGCATVASAAPQELHLLPAANPASARWRDRRRGERGEVRGERRRGRGSQSSIYLRLMRRCSTRVELWRHARRHARRASPASMAVPARAGQRPRASGIGTRGVTIISV